MFYSTYTYLEILFIIISLLKKSWCSALGTSAMDLVGLLLTLHIL
jgi:hypothetical protein